MRPRSVARESFIELLPRKDGHRCGWQLDRCRLAATRLTSRGDLHLAAAGSGNRFAWAGTWRELVAAKASTGSNVLARRSAAVPNANAVCADYFRHQVDICVLVCYVSFRSSVFPFGRPVAGRL